MPSVAEMRIKEKFFIRGNPIKHFNLLLLLLSFREKRKKQRKAKLCCARRQYFVSSNCENALACLLDRLTRFVFMNAPTRAERGYFCD
jgi:hypothetical protein